MESEKNKIRVLLADDHQILIDGISSILQKENDISIVAEANTGVEVMGKLVSEPIDIVVLDIGMPEMDGYDTVLEIHEKHPGVKVLILSLFNDEYNIARFLREGVAGYVIKARGANEIVKAIRQVAAGTNYYDSEVQAVMANIIKNKNAGPDKTVRLSDKEEAVLHLFAEGYKSKEIGEKLYISASTVETHKRNAAEKLGLKISQLRKYAIEKGYSAKAFKSKK